MTHSKRLLALEPYYGGSHRAWIDGWRRHSRYTIDLLTLPARKWKWRMRGAAIVFSEQLEERYPNVGWDGLIATDMMNLAEFLALTRPRLERTPVVLYLHENQIGYPLHPEERRDYHYAITNFVSVLSASKAVFNSEYNRKEFFSGIRSIFAQMPDCRPPTEMLDSAEASCEVIPPAIELHELRRARQPDGGAPVILWNHRWERDKQPERFTDAIDTLLSKSIPFRLIVCGEHFREIPSCFLKIKESLGDRLLHFGFAESRAEYADLLSRSDIVVSTALQEYFGISVVEAMHAGAFPLLPNRLAYPELIPAEYRDEVLYEDNELMDRLGRAIQCSAAGTLPDLRDTAQRYDWSHRIESYDGLFDHLEHTHN